MRKRIFFLSCLLILCAQFLFAADNEKTNIATFDLAHAGKRYTDEEINAILRKQWETLENSNHTPSAPEIAPKKPYGGPQVCYGKELIFPE